MEVEKLEEISRKVEEVKTLFNSAMNKVNERDEMIKSKDARIQELTDKLVTVSKEKDDALWAKIDLMKAITKEREDMHEEVSELKQEMIRKEQTIKKLKRKSREMQDGLMGTSFEVDRMKKEVATKEEAIKEIEEKVASVATGSTGILYDIKSSVEYIQNRIGQANRSLRLVVPNIDFMIDNELMELVDELPESCVVNIATALNLDEHNELIEKWKGRGWYVNNYQGQNFLMSSANGSDVSIAYYSEGRVSGFYSNIEDLVTIFKQALMHPFIKGQKL